MHINFHLTMYTVTLQIRLRASNQSEITIYSLRNAWWIFVSLASLTSFVCPHTIFVTGTNTSQTLSISFYYDKTSTMSTGDTAFRKELFCAVEQARPNHIASVLKCHRGIFINQWISYIVINHTTSFHVTDHLGAQCTGHRWIPLTKATDTQLWEFPWTSSEQTVE